MGMEGNESLYIFTGGKGNVFIYYYENGMEMGMGGNGIENHYRVFLEARSQTEIVLSRDEV